MAIRIGHASSARGHIELGDQYQKIDKNGYDMSGEVRFQSYYCKYATGWDALIRPKDPLVAEKMAIAMEQACNNPNIGYHMDGTGRRKLDIEAKKYNYDLSKVGPCTCDCSSLIGICIKAAGINNSLPTTGNMPNEYGKMTEHFEVITKDSKYLTSDKYLRRGDVLVKKNAHTIMIVGDSPLAFPPIITSITELDHDTICIKGSTQGLEGITTGVKLYYAYNTENVTEDLTTFVTVNTFGEFTCNLDRKDTTVTLVSILPVQLNNNGFNNIGNIVSQALTPTGTFINIYVDNDFKQALPCIYTNGEWRIATPDIYANNQWNVIRNIVEE